MLNEPNTDDSEAHTVTNEPFRACGRACVAEGGLLVRRQESYHEHNTLACVGFDNVHVGHSTQMEGVTFARQKIGKETGTW